MLVIVFNRCLSTVKFYTSRILGFEGRSPTLEVIEQCDVRRRRILRRSQPQHG